MNLLQPAGGQLSSKSKYLFDRESYFWLMSPYGTSDVNHFNNTTGWLGSVWSSSITSSSVSLRPVINLKSDVVFKSGTDGSKTNPYEIELGQ